MKNTLLLFLLISNFIYAQHDITIDISSPNTLASEIELQHQFNVVNFYNGGTITFNDISPNNNASIIIDDAIVFSSNINIVATNNGNEYGIVFKGAKKDGLEYRSINNPLFIAADNTSNVLFDNIRFDGKPTINGSVVDLNSASIVMNNSEKITIQNCFVDDAVRRGFTAQNSKELKITNTKVLLRFHDHYPLTRDNGAAGIWFKGVENSVIENCEVWSPTYYKNNFTIGKGICWRDPRVGTEGNITPTIELISSYDGLNNVFQNNYVHDGNTTAFYICGSDAEEEVVGRGNGEIIKNNTIINFGQLSLDIANQDNIQITDNIVMNSDLPNLGYADCHNGTITDNVFMGSCIDISAEDNHSGALFLLWGSSNNVIESNDIHTSCDESKAKYGVIFSGIDRLGNDAKVSSNSIINNRISTGSVDFYGGEDLVFNTISPNIESNTIISANKTELELNEGAVGTVYLAWSSNLQNSEITIWLKTNAPNSEAQLFSAGQSCSEGIEVPWISPDVEYVFSVWKSSGNNVDDRIEELSSITINGVLNKTLNYESSYQNEDIKFTIYPNPTNNFINISVDNLMGFKDKQIVISSATGAIMYNQKIISNEYITVDLSNFNKGIYFVNITSNSKSLGVRELIIK